MDTSSAQQTYSITLDDTIDISSLITADLSTAMTASMDTVILDLGNVDAAYSITTTGSNGYSGGTITIDDSIFSNNWIATVPFENGFPEWDDFQNMCKEYPGLEQAYEKLKTFYELCKDEWAHKKKGLE